MFFKDDKLNIYTSKTICKSKNLIKLNKRKSIRLIVCQHAKLRSKFYRVNNNEIVFSIIKTRISMLKITAFLSCINICVETFIKPGLTEPTNLIRGFSKAKARITTTNKDLTTSTNFKKATPKVNKDTGAAANVQTIINVTGFIVIFILLVTISCICLSTKNVSSHKK